MDSFNKAIRFENSILDQIYEELVCSDFYYKDFKFHENGYTHKKSTKTKFYELLIL